MSQKILGIPFAVFGGLVLVVAYLIVKDKGKRGIRSGMGSIQMPKIVSDNKLVFGIVVGFAVCWLMNNNLEGFTLTNADFASSSNLIDIVRHASNDETDNACCKTSWLWGSDNPAVDMISEAKDSEEGNQCKDCRNCWNPEIKNISYGQH